MLHAVGHRRYIAALSQLKMNYMPGTASLIEDIDSE